MKKKKLFCMLSAVCLAVSCMLPAFAAEGIEGEEDVTLDFGNAEFRSQKNTNGNLIITLDPGHGGDENGATVEYDGQAVYEKQLNLKIAQACKEELEKYQGVTVYMTRSGDTTSSLSQRVQYAVDRNSNILISMHNDAYEDLSINGSIMLIPIESSYRYYLHTQSKQVAECIRSSLRTVGMADRGYWLRNGSKKYPDGSTADYYGLIRNARLANLPSLIIEHAVLTNENDYRSYLSSDDKLTALGVADAQGIAQAYGLQKLPPTAADRGDAPFTDVHTTDWYYDAVIWGYQEKVIQGMSTTSFAPELSCTRAQAVQMLYNFMGAPAVSGTNTPFTDVSDNEWYTTAVKWAADNSITNGTSDTTFSPDAVCTRAQIVQLLWRVQGCEAADSASPFTDVTSDAWYSSAVNWAAQKHITSGMTETIFAPDSTCTRAQIVTFFRNLSAAYPRT